MKELHLDLEKKIQGNRLDLERLAHQLEAMKHEIDLQLRELERHLGPRLEEMERALVKQRHGLEEVFEEEDEEEWNHDSDEFEDE